MKVLGSHVTSVRRSMLFCIISRRIYFGWRREAVSLQWMSSAFLHSRRVETSSANTLRLQAVYLWFV